MSISERYMLHAFPRRDAPERPPGVSTLADLFEWQANRRQDATLFSFYGGKAIPRTLSYRESYRQVVMLAQQLHRLLDSPPCGSSVIGVWLEKSLELHLAILAVTFAGATWLPFDADAPPERVTACLTDSEAQLLLCDKAHYSAAQEAVKQRPNTRVVLFDHLLCSTTQPAHQQPVPTRPCRPEARHSAYMIYTSGSTGTPKGIDIPHGAALTFAMSEQTILQTGPNDIVWQGFSAAFDMFVEEVWVSIAGGGHLTIGSREECRDVPGLGGASGLWAQRGVTVVNAVPTLINIMTSLDEECSLPYQIRLLNLGGEACPPALVKRLWHSKLRIINTYGPSETTVTATFQELIPEQAVTIGKPLPSYHALLLPIAHDHEGPGPLPTVPLELCEGAEGELAIGGACLANGYVGRPQLTAEKFIQHPFAANGQRLYRTGDRVHLDANRNLLFLGRIDTQVKHRGFRIELGEIECALSSHADVQTVAVILSAATCRLEAYLVSKGSVLIEAQELRATLSMLPAYMHPEAFTFLLAEQMPRLPSGKINAKALQEVSKERAEEEKRNQQAFAANAAVKQEHLSIDPTSELAILLAALSAVFPQAGVILPSSDFFDDLGGHSLAAAMLVSRLRKSPPELSALRGLGLQDIYVCRTPERIAAKFDMASNASTEVNEAEMDEKEDFVGFNAGAPSGVSTGEIWDVSQVRFVLCGLAQIPALLFVWFLQSLQFFVPYLVFVAVHLSLNNIAWAILATYAAFVITPLFIAFVAFLGKWTILGRSKPGEYPLYGVYYYRWWLVGQLIGMMELSKIAETPLIGFFWRSMGASVGVHCHIGQVLARDFDLIEIGNDVVLSNSVDIATSCAERGRLILKPVKIGSGVFIGSNSVLEGGCVVEPDAEVLRLSMVPDGMRIPSAQRWHGSPARYCDDSPHVGLARRTRASKLRVLLTGLAISLLTMFGLPIVWLAPQIPTLILFEAASVPHLGQYWAQIAVFAIPAAFAYLILVFVEMVVLRWLFLGKVKEGTIRTTSIPFIRRWFVDRIMALSLTILHPVYATLYVIPYLRALGVQIGDRAEVSTVTGINFNLTEIGDESFVADNVHIGPVEVRGNAIELRKTTFAKRAFAGNSSVIPQGSTLPSNTLVGVLSVAPDPVMEKPMHEGQSCFGSPLVMMPARQPAKVCHPPHLLYAPKAGQIAMRLFIEGARIVLPRAVVVLGIGFGVSIFRVAYAHVGVVQTALMLPFFHFFMFALPALVISLICKWTLIGRYAHDEWPLWSTKVWRSEFVTSTYESLCGPALTGHLTGTPYLAMCFRLFGVKVGKRVTLLHNDITEYDMVTIGDEAIINSNAGTQTHLFEDRVMKIGSVHVGSHATLKAYSICLPHSCVQDNAQVGTLSLVMKGETVPANEAWEGAPIVPRRKRRRAPITSNITLDVSASDGPSSNSSFSASYVESNRYNIQSSMTTANTSNSTLVGALHWLPASLSRPRGDGSRTSSKATRWASHTRHSSPDSAKPSETPSRQSDHQI